MTFLAAISPSNKSNGTTLSVAASLATWSLLIVTFGSSCSRLLTRLTKIGLLVTGRKNVKKINVLKLVF